MGVPPTQHHENGDMMRLGRRSGNVGLLWYYESARKLTWKLSVPRIGPPSPLSKVVMKRSFSERRPTLTSEEAVVWNS
jgi:hypothetical protein